MLELHIDSGLSRDRVNQPNFERTAAMKPTSLKSIYPPGTRRPAGHYSPGVICGDILYVAGQLPIDPVTGERESGSVEVQLQLVLKNLDRILLAAGSRRDLVVQTTIFTPDLGLWEKINAVYAEYFGEHRPARAVVPTAPLNHGFLIELTATAAVDPKAIDASASSRSATDIDSNAPIDAVVNSAVDSANDVGG